MVYAIACTLHQHLAPCSFYIQIAVSLLVRCISFLMLDGCAGNPKGVVLTHHTLVTAVASLQGFVDLGNIRMGPDDSFLSFLTLAHIFDRVVEEFMLSVGGHIGYWQVGIVQPHPFMSALLNILFDCSPFGVQRSATKKCIDFRLALHTPPLNCLGRQCSCDST